MFPFRIYASAKASSESCFLPRWCAIFKPIMEISVPFPRVCGLGKVSVRLIAGGKCMRGRIIGAFECCCCWETTKKVFLRGSGVPHRILNSPWCAFLGRKNLDRGWRSTAASHRVSYTRTRSPSTRAKRVN